MIEIKFGTIIIDKLHQFFGMGNPVACVVVSGWSNEEDDGENKKVWIEHYRGHFRCSYKDLRDKKKWQILDKRIDTSFGFVEQLVEAEQEYKTFLTIKKLKKK